MQLEHIFDLLEYIKNFNILLVNLEGDGYIKKEHT